MLLLILAVLAWLAWMGHIKMRWYRFNVIAIALTFVSVALLVVALANNANMQQKITIKQAQRQYIVASMEEAVKQKDKRMLIARKTQVSLWNAEVESYHQHAGNAMIGFLYSRKLSDALEPIDMSEWEV